MSSFTFEHLVETVHRLRAPGGCPWDQAQTHQSLRPFIIEEAHEVLEVIDRFEDATPWENVASQREAFKEELGDLLMQVVLHSEMASEKGAFTFKDVAQGLHEKLIRRHPHVFGETKVGSADEALRSWEAQKAKEKAAQGTARSALDGIPKGLPALSRAAKVIDKVSRVGFQWPDLEGPLAKLDEELAELKAALKELGSEPAASQRARVASEVGDLLFCLANVAHLLKIQPEDALREQLHRFEGRFKHVEKRLAEKGSAPERSTLEEMDKYWDEAKALEKAKASPKASQ